MSWQNNKNIELVKIISILLIFYLLSPSIGWSQDNRVEKLIKDLKDGNSIDRGEAAEALGLIKYKKAVKPLIEVLKDKDESGFVRANAAIALGRIKDPRAVKPLIEVLKDKDLYTQGGVPVAKAVLRWQVAEALGDIQDPRAVEPLIAALKDEDECGFVRARAAEVLDEDPNLKEEKSLSYRNMDRIRNEAFLKLEIRMMSAEIRMSAATALGQIGDKKAVEPLIQVLKEEKSLRNMSRIRNEAFLKLEIRMMSAEIRMSAATALGQIGDKRAVKPLIAALKDEDIRTKAAEALVNIGAIEPLIQVLKDKTDGVRDEVVKVLGQIGDEKAVEPLVQVLRDEDEGVRARAAEALGDIQDPRAVEPLIAALKDEDECGFVRSNAALALGKIGDEKAVEPLVQVLRDEDLGVRMRAATALGKIGDKRAVEPLVLQVLKESKDEDEYRLVRRNAIEALVNIGIEPLIEVLRDEEDVNVRKSAVFALSYIQDPKAVKALIEALRDEKPEIRWNAAWALGDIQDPRAVEPLIAALKDEDLDVRARAAEALRSIGDKRAVEPLIQVLREEEKVLIRQIAVGALGNIGDKRAVEPLIQVLREEEDKKVRRAAVRELRRIGTPEALKAVESYENQSQVR